MSGFFFGSDDANLRKSKKFHLLKICSENDWYILNPFCLNLFSCFSFLLCFSFAAASLFEFQFLCFRFFFLFVNYKNAVCFWNGITVPHKALFSQIYIYIYLYYFLVLFFFHLIFCLKKKFRYGFLMGHYDITFFDSTIALDSVICSFCYTGSLSLSLLNIDL